MDNAQLEAERNNRQQKLAQLVDATNAVQAAPRSPESAQLKSATAAAANSLYSIGLYSFGANEDVLRKATDALTKDGYTIIASTSLTEKPPWLASRPTVFYYRPKAADKARAIAQDLQRLTGVKFDVTIGNGLGIPKGQEETNLRIHFI